MQVRDVMTPNLISVGEDATLLEALRTLVDRKVSALAVLDDKGAAVGVLSEGDLMRRAELGTQKRRPAWLEFILGGGRTAEDYLHSHGRRVGEIMTRGAFTVETYAEIAEAVDQMIAHKVKRLIVVSDGRAVGVLSRSAVLKALLVALPEPGAPRSDAEIQADISAQFDREPWAPRGGVRTVVEGGIVTLEGAISDDRLRPALKVLVENIAGVKGVRDQLAWIEPNSGFLVPAEEEKG
jgi:CBS domain-containing protein